MAQATAAATHTERTAFGVILALLIVLTLRSTGIASPLGTHCAATSLEEKRKSETAEVAFRLPHGYRVFEIVPGRNVLKVVAPFEKDALAQKRVPASRISQIWDDVLSKHGSFCDFNTVEFISAGGKRLFAVVEGYTE